MKIVPGLARKSCSLRVSNVVISLAFKMKETIKLEDSLRGSREYLRDGGMTMFK